VNYEKAAKAYLDLNKKIADIEAEAKAATAPLKKQIKDIETWFTLKADEEGLKNIPTQLGTAYWSTHSSAKVADRTAFFEYVKANDAYHMLEARCNKTAVAEFIDEAKTPPPGVDFSQVRVFNFRANKEGDK
jgi:hypothetical protein